MKNVLQIFFPEWFGPKQIEAIRFRNEFHDKSAQTDGSKEMWIPILKRLKHLNLDIIINRPSVAGAVLQAPQLIIDLFTDGLSKYL